MREMLVLPLDIQKFAENFLWQGNTTILNINNVSAEKNWFSEKVQVHDKPSHIPINNCDPYRKKMEIYYIQVRFHRILLWTRLIFTNIYIWNFWTGRVPSFCTGLVELTFLVFIIDLFDLAGTHADMYPYFLENITISNVEKLKLWQHFHQSLRTLLYDISISYPLPYLT